MNDNSSDLFASLDWYFLLPVFYFIWFFFLPSPTSEYVYIFRIPIDRHFLPLSLLSPLTQRQNCSAQFIHIINIRKGICPKKRKSSERGTKKLFLMNYRFEVPLCLTAAAAVFYELRRCDEWYEIFLTSWVLKSRIIWFDFLLLFSVVCCECLLSLRLSLPSLFACSKSCWSWEVGRSSSKKNVVIIIGTEKTARSLFQFDAWSEANVPTFPVIITRITSKSTEAFSFQLKSSLIS